MKAVVRPFIAIGLVLMMVFVWFPVYVLGFLYEFGFIFGFQSGRNEAVKMLDRIESLIARDSK